MKMVTRNLYFAEMNLAGQAAAEPGGISRIAELTRKVSSFASSLVSLTSKRPKSSGSPNPPWNDGGPSPAPGCTAKYGRCRDCPYFGLILQAGLEATENAGMILIFFSPKRLNHPLTHLYEDRSALHGLHPH
jgi:hypothetical protein